MWNARVSRRAILKKSSTHQNPTRQWWSAGSLASPSGFRPTPNRRRSYRSATARQGGRLLLLRRPKTRVTPKTPPKSEPHSPNPNRHRPPRRRRNRTHLQAVEIGIARRILLLTKFSRTSCPEIRTGWMETTTAYLVNNRTCPDLSTSHGCDFLVSLKRHSDYRLDSYMDSRLSSRLRRALRAAPVDSYRWASSARVRSWVRQHSSTCRRSGEDLERA